MRPFRRSQNSCLSGFLANISGVRHICAHWHRIRSSLWISIGSYVVYLGTVSKAKSGVISGHLLSNVPPCLFTASAFRLIVAALSHCCPRLLLDAIPHVSRVLSYRAFLPPWNLCSLLLLIGPDKWRGGCGWEQQARAH